MTRGAAEREVFASCWVGERLLPIANACINSFDAHGFAFRLYTYGEVKGVPAFVERREGESLASSSEIFVAHGGFETFTDLFGIRYLGRFGGWWVDSDVVCNTDRIPRAEVAFAEERAGIINNAVLKFPARHPAIVHLLEHAATVDPVSSPWGSLATQALTAVLRQHDLARYQRATSDFYPLHWKEAPKLLFPEFAGEILERTAGSPFIHLWGATLREVGFDFAHSLPIEGSYLDLLYRRHLDRDVAASLAPIDEDQFRRSVQDYVAREWREWNVALKLI